MEILVSFDKKICLNYLLVEEFWAVIKSRNEEWPAQKKD